MNYKHLFHAGNFADVFKHCVLITLLSHLSKKNTPFCYLETHAGSGLYFLQDINSKKTKEYENGIERVISNYSNITHPFIKEYLNIVNEHHYPEQYPGSPLIVQSFLKKQQTRHQDRMILCEWQTEVFSDLKNLFWNEGRVQLHHQNGYDALKAFLPPLERRGLILIDPPFEKSDEWDAIISSTLQGIKKFPQGVYAIWYPIKDKQVVLQFKEKLKTMINSLDIPVSKEVLNAEIILYPEELNFGLIGCGMIIINPPWQIDQELYVILKELIKFLSEEKGSYTVRFL